jgi:hypothetical protein
VAHRPCPAADLKNKTRAIDVIQVSKNHEDYTVMNIEDRR